jgi:HSP20 family protein
MRITLIFVPWLPGYHFFRPVTDTRLLADDARRLLDELDRDLPGAAMSSGECRPALDIIETADGAEVVVDVAGLPAAALRVAIRRETVLVVGAKLAPATPADVRFHLAERNYGRFARAVRVTGAFDASRARAIVHNGLLRVVLPRIEDRRGHLMHLDVETE